MSFQHHHINNNGYFNSSSSWNLYEDKVFETALSKFPEEECVDRWAKIAAQLPEKSLVDIKHHYDLLIDDVRRIESGIIPLPTYELSVDENGGRCPLQNYELVVDENGGKKQGCPLQNYELVVDENGGKKHGHRKGIPWTENEHKLFLLGLETYGKGDWRSISRNFVLTKSATQIASHAQKYFMRKSSCNKEKRRISIHDISMDSFE